VSLVSLPAGMPAARSPRGGSDDPPTRRWRLTSLPPEAEADRARSEDKKAVKKQEEKPKAKDGKPTRRGCRQEVVRTNDSGLHSLVKGAAARGGGVGVPGFSSQLQLDIENFEFSYYLVAVRNKVSSNWSRRPAGHADDKGQDGGLLPYTEERKGRRREDGDPVGHRAVRPVGPEGRAQSEPFPPLPGGFPGGSLGVHFGFEYAR